MIYKGVAYRKNDFIYCIPEISGAPYCIGQIENFDLIKSNQESQKRPGTRGTGSAGGYNSTAKTSGVKVKLLRRYDELLGKDFKTQLAEDLPVLQDSRRLYYTQKKVQIPAAEIEGKCFVLHRENIGDLDAWKDQEDTFWYDSGVDNKTSTPIRLGMLKNTDGVDIRVCEETILEKGRRDRLMECFELRGEKLRAMDVFAGAGGLTIGLEKGGAIKTHWAIEHEASPAMSFKLNLPDVIVYNQCANILLDRAIKNHGNEELDNLVDAQGGITPDMPNKGEVHFIYGGPPCQGFSGLNRFKKEKDIRNTFIATFLSYVDFYRPDYFLLENVKGLLDHKFGNIKMGTVKLIFRSLTSMGYQARMDLLHAGRYGVPQNRRRVFFWGTKLGMEIPLFPKTTHCSPKNDGSTIKLSDGKILSYNEKGSHAPHPPVVVGDVIVDLPGFEYANPYRVYTMTVHNEIEDSLRPWKKYDTSLPRLRKEDYVGLKKQTYRYPPLTEYQRSLRREVKEEVLTGHFTRRFGFTNTERICSIGLEVGSDHRSLPAGLKPWCLSHPDSKALSNNMYPGLYGRLDPDGIFNTAVTVITPSGKSGTVLHPTQHRVISVREHARCQGFPDSYHFLSFHDKTAELHKQIGNAVPIPLAEALGKKLREAVVENWKKRGQLQRP